MAMGSNRRLKVCDYIALFVWIGKGVETVVADGIVAIARNALAQQESEMADILDDPFLPAIIEDRSGCSC
jgi:hypothetical protein